MSSLITRLSISLVALLTAIAFGLAGGGQVYALGDPTGDMEPVSDPVPGNTFGTPIGPPQGGRGDITDVSIEFVPGGVRVCVTRLSDVVTTSSAILWIFGAPGAPQVVAFWENHEGTVTTGASRGGMTVPAAFEVDPAGARGCITIPFEHLGDSQTVYAHSFSRQTPLGQEPPPEGDPRLRDISDYQPIGQPPSDDDTTITDSDDPGSTDPGTPPNSTGDDPGSDSGEPSSPPNDGAPDAGAADQPSADGTGDDDAATTPGDDAGTVDDTAAAATDDGDAAADAVTEDESGAASSDDAASGAPDSAARDDAAADEGADGVDEPGATEPDDASGEADGDDDPAAPAAGISDDSAVDPGEGDGIDGQLLDEEDGGTTSWILALVFLLLAIGFVIAGGGVFIYTRLRPERVLNTLGDLNSDGVLDLGDVRSFREQVTGQSDTEPMPAPVSPHDPLGAQMSVVMTDVMMVRADGKRWSGADIPMHFARELRDQAAGATDRNEATERLYEALEMEHEGLAGGGEPPASDDPELERDRQGLSEPYSLTKRLADIDLALQEIDEWFD